MIFLLHAKYKTSIIRSYNSRERYLREKKGLEIEYGTNAINIINSPTSLLIYRGSL
jgi:hypothetical protein